MRLILLFLFAFSVYAEEKRPNVLFIYTDDQSTRTVSCYPDAHDWVKTPEIDKLASEGVLFTHAYIGAWCMTSRANILTGLHQHGIQTMRMEGEYPRAVYDPEKCRFWAKDFKEKGYHTAMLGKWHTGIDSGFGRDWDYQKVWNRPKYPENAPNYYYDQLIETNGGKPVMTKGYTTDNYTDWAVDYIKGGNRDKKKPFFLWLCYGAVHGPFTPAKRHLDDYPDARVPQIGDLYPSQRVDKPAYVMNMEMWGEKDGIPVEMPRKNGKTPVAMKDLPGRPLKDSIRQYNQGVSAIDEAVGRLMKTLKETGEDENTIIIYTSDQGFAWGQHGFKSKVAPYFATIAAPLIFRMPKKFRDKYMCEGTVVNAPVSGIDIPSTIYSLIGQKTPWYFHGYDLTPLLQKPNADWQKPAVVVHYASQFGSATDVIPPTGDPKLYHGPGVPWYVMASQGRYKYIRTLVAGEPEEFYDLVSDPQEIKNLAPNKKYKELMDKYRKIMVDELKRTGAKFVDKMPAVKKYY
ncbi:MAG: sulfatase-like hydrolase/transferase [Lentisphaeraceae bacterium]|nr:sulfatase-like hydrolase/transferase [Lentisphaeraceae bacterium]